MKNGDPNRAHPRSLAVGRGPRGGCGSLRAFRNATQWRRLRGPGTTRTDGGRMRMRFFGIGMMYIYAHMTYVVCAYFWLGSIYEDAVYIDIYIYTYICLII